MSIEYSPLFAFSLPSFVFGCGGYALSRKFVPSVAVATAAGVAAMFVIAHLTTGTSGMARGIVGLTVLSALFSWFGAFSIRSLAGEIERVGRKRTAAAVVAGLLLGAAVLLAVFYSPPKNIGAIFWPLVGLAGVGAFTIAMKTDSMGGSAGGIVFAMAAPIFFFDSTGYAIGIYCVTFLPITIAGAALGGPFGRWRRRHAEERA